MNNIILSKKQAKGLAQTIYEDIKGYCLANYDRYFPWLIDDMRKSKGFLPAIPFATGHLPCPHCGRNFVVQVSSMRGDKQKKKAERGYIKDERKVI